MAIQTSYVENITALQEGQIVNQETATTISRVVETTAGIGFGKVAIQGAADNGIIVSAAAGTAAGAAVAGNTGNGTITAEPTVSAGAIPGVYDLVAIEPASDAGTFEVRDPNGKIVGVATVAVEFDAAGLTFTIADGGTDFVAGDRFTITVTGAPLFRGITIRDPSAPDPEGTADTYPRYKPAGVMTKGVIAVTASVAVSVGDKAYFVPAGGAITNVAADNIPIPNAIFDADAAMNALVPLRLG